jgi:hypothetical protein
MTRRRRLTRHADLAGDRPTLLRRVVANIAARIGTQRDEGNIIAAATLLRAQPGETREAILHALARPRTAGFLWRYARLPSTRHAARFEYK